MKNTLVFLAPPDFANELALIGGKLIHDWQVHVVNELDSLITLFESKSIGLLISFGTSVIVPGWILTKPGLQAINLHAASPYFPGRDPHHFAIYDKVTRYGATLHVMTSTVDDGPIIDVAWFDVSPNNTPASLLERANEAALELMVKHLPDLLAGSQLQPHPEYKWAGVKRRRKDFLELCRVDASMGEDEIQRRQNACEMPGHSNLFTVICGRRFVIDQAHPDH